MLPKPEKGTKARAEFDQIERDLADPNCTKYDAFREALDQIIKEKKFGIPVTIIREPKK